MCGVVRIYVSLCTTQTKEVVLLSMSCSLWKHDGSNHIQAFTWETKGTKGPPSFLQWNYKLRQGRQNTLSCNEGIQFFQTKALNLSRNMWNTGEKHKPISWMAEKVGPRDIYLTFRKTTRYYDTHLSHKHTVVVVEADFFFKLIVVSGHRFHQLKSWIVSVVFFHLLILI